MPLFFRSESVYPEVNPCYLYLLPYFVLYGRSMGRGIAIDPHRIKQLRTELDMTLREFATHTGLSLDALWRYETGQGRPYPRMLAHIEKACGTERVQHLVPDGEEWARYTDHPARQFVVFGNTH